MDNQFRIPNEAQIFLLHLILFHRVRDYAPDIILGEDELKHKKDTILWLSEHGWIEHEPGEESDKVRPTELAKANKKVIGELHEQLNRA